jgi:hypothetical protein
VFKKEEIERSNFMAWSAAVGLDPIKRSFGLALEE